MADNDKTIQQLLEQLESRERYISQKYPEISAELDEFEPLEMKSIRRIESRQLDLPPIDRKPFDVPDRREFTRAPEIRSIERLFSDPRAPEIRSIERTNFPEVPRIESRSFDVPEATLKPSLPRLSDLLRPFVKVDAEEYVEAEQERKKRQRMVDAQDAFDFSSLSEK